MIPKIIHYCWFGGNPLPEQAQKCIASWKKYLPDYEIKEWNESNFDLNACPYVAEAYREKKWAFVSDYARFWILYRYGGLYFDTDVEIIKPIDDIIEKGAFIGTECSTPNAKITGEYLVNPGVALGGPASLPFFKEILDQYSKRHYIDENGIPDKTTICDFVTSLLVNDGLKKNTSIELIDDIYIYPPEVFCPLNYSTGKTEITENTRSIHWYSATWLTDYERRLIRIVQWSSRFGTLAYPMEKIVSFPIRAWRKLQLICKRVFNKNTTNI